MMFLIFSNSTPNIFKIEKDNFDPFKEALAFLFQNIDLYVFDDTNFRIYLSKPQDPSKWVKIVFLDFLGENVSINC